MSHCFKEGEKCVRLRWGVGVVCDDRLQRNFWERNVTMHETSLYVCLRETFLPQCDTEHDVEWESLCEIPRNEESSGSWYKKNHRRTMKNHVYVSLKEITSHLPYLSGRE